MKKFTQEDTDLLKTVILRKTERCAKKYHVNSSEVVPETIKAINDCIATSQFGCQKEQVQRLVEAIILHCTNEPVKLGVKDSPYGPDHGVRGGGEAMTVLTAVNTPGTQYLISTSGGKRISSGGGISDAGNYANHYRYATPEEAESFLNRFLADGLNNLSTNYTQGIEDFISSVRAAVGE